MPPPASGTLTRRRAQVPGPWQTVPLFPNSRSIIFTGLTPGSSEWSNPVSHMSLQRAGGAR